MNHVSELAQWLILAGAACAVVGGWWRWVRPRIRSARAKGDAFSDAILGRPAILHPDTGKELVPAVPGIGARQANIEQQISVLTGAVSQMANQGRRLDSHEERLAILEAGAQERAQLRTESIEMLRAMEAAMNSTPPRDAR